MWGSCELSRHGETPPDARFDFRNGVHVNNKQVMLSKQVDYLAYYVSKHGKGLSPPLPDCEAWVRAKYGKPDYEDSVLIVWRINSAAAPLSK